MEKAVLSLVVENHANVLARVASLFSRRGFNIDSLTVSTTDNPEVSRITIVTEGDALILKQIIQQTEKLIETKLVFVLDSEKSLLRELLLLKIAADDDSRSRVKEIAEIYHAKIIDVTPTCMTLELTGRPDKIDSFLGMLKKYKVVEMCRTGITGMERGENSYVTQVLHGKA